MHAFGQCGGGHSNVKNGISYENDIPFFGCMQKSIPAQRKGQNDHFSGGIDLKTNILFYRIYTVDKAQKRSHTGVISFIYSGVFKHF